VKVTVLNIDTGVSTDYVTNQDGLFDTSSILPGRYMITFTKQGFGKLVRGPVTLNVGYLSVNANLKVGSTTQQVTVTADVPLLKTETGDQTVTLEDKEMSQLPLISQDWSNFMVLLPGTTGMQGNTINPQQATSANGNLPYTNVLNDGASTSYAQSDNSFSQGGIESLAELQVSLSSFSAQYGVGGMIMSKITKSGTSKFHGSAYDYIQNDAFDSRPHYYGNGTPPKIPLLRYNDFGFSLGGPVLKKKMFFYFNYDQTVNHAAANAGLATVPTAAIMGGDFSSIKKTLYDPTTQTIAIDSKGNPYPVRKSFLQEYGSNAIPSSMIDKVASAAQAFYPTPSSHLSGGTFKPGTPNTIGVLQNNWYASQPNSNPWRRYVGRLDYDITQRNRLTASVSDLDNPGLGLSNITACPLGCQAQDQEIENSQVSDVWNISPSIINEARMGYTWGISAYADDALGKGYASKIGWKFAKADTFPSLGLSNYEGISPASNSVYKQHVFDPSDVVTMIRGKHILHFGGEFLFYRNDNTQWGNTNAGSMNFSGNYTDQWALDAQGVAHKDPNGNTGLDYADFLLGLSNGWNAAVTPEYGARMKNPELFFQDDYKVRPNLTLNLGLRYDISHGWREVKGNERTFDPAVPNPAGGLGAMWYGSTHANGRTSLQASVFNTFLPRLGFSWQPQPNTTVRGGFGLYDHMFSLDVYGNGMGSAFGSSGSVSDQSNGITPVVKLDGSGTLYGTSTPLPYVVASTDPGAYNGQNQGYNAFHSPIQKIYEWTMSVQRELSPNLVAQVAYVASHGFNLPVSNDINAIPAGKLSSNDAQYRPYPNFGNLGGNALNGVSNYNSLQAEITKRFTSGLSFNINYVWSHFLDDEDTAGWCCQAGSALYQIANNSAANYSNANFDIRHALKGYGVYQLPFGKGMRFLNDNALLDAVFRDGSPGSLWVSANDGCKPAGDTSVRSCVRLIEVSILNGAASVAQDFDYSAAGKYFFYPAIRTDNSGNLFAVFNGSSASQNISVYGAIQRTNDPSDTLRTPALLKSGTNAYTESARWGDYSGAGFDSSNGSIWLGGEYPTSCGFLVPSCWGTWIENVSP